MAFRRDVAAEEEGQSSSGLRRKEVSSKEEDPGVYYTGWHCWGGNRRCGRPTGDLRVPTWVTWPRDQQQLQSFIHII